MPKVKAFMLDNSGATAIEYALIAALIAVAAIVGMRQAGSMVFNTFRHVRDGIRYGDPSGG